MNIVADVINVAVAAEALREGQTVAYPTETSYGFGCDATNQEAVNKIFQIKGREVGKPMLVVVAELEQIRPYIVWDERLELINKKYWPGPLTVIVQASSSTALADGVVSADGWLAFRVTSHPIARELSESLGKPLVSTSANEAGKPPMYSAQEIIRVFEAKSAQPDILIDVGNLPEVLPSTIIKLVLGNIEVVRQGAVTVEL